MQAGACAVHREQQEPSSCKPSLAEQPCQHFPWFSGLLPPTDVHTATAFSAVLAKKDSRQSSLHCIPSRLSAPPSTLTLFIYLFILQCPQSTWPALKLQRRKRVSGTRFYSLSLPLTLTSSLKGTVKKFENYQPSLSQVITQ